MSLTKLAIETKNLLRSKHLSDDKKRQFKKACKSMLVALLQELQELYTENWLSSKNTDQTKQYDLLLEAAQSEHKDATLTFNHTKGRIDSFIDGFVHGNTKYEKCWDVCKLVLTVSRGQASVERGFSVNKELLVENLQEVSLVCHRIAYDHVMDTGESITDLPMPNELLKL